MPYCILSDKAIAFVQSAYGLGLVLAGFDWPAWKETAKAIQLRADPEALAQVSVGQLAKLLTALIRQDRFVEGGLNATYQSGLLMAIVARAESLLQEAEP